MSLTAWREIFEISDRVTVLKDGRVTGVRETARTTHKELISLMVGRELSFEPDPRRASQDAAVALELRNLSAAPVKSASFTLRYGEILCLAGLLGAGRTETCEAIFGARPIQSGQLFVGGKELRPKSPVDSMKAGISMLPEDRKDGGLFMDFTIEANLIAANLDAYTHQGLLSRKETREVSEKYVELLRVATPNIEREVRYLSGGNQQKVLLAKWLVREPRILIVDEPTRGVDVGSKADIYRILRDLAASGMALLVVSSDLPEVLALAAPHRRHVRGPCRRRTRRRECNRDRHSRACRSQTRDHRGSGMSSETAAQPRQPCERAGISWPALPPTARSCSSS